MNSNPIDATTPRRYMPFTARRVGAAAGVHAADALRSGPRAVAGVERAGVGEGGRRDLPAAVAPAQPACRGDPGLHAATAKFLGTTKPRAAVHHRRRRQRRGGQEHHLASAAGAAGALARSSRASIWSPPTASCCRTRVLEDRGLMKRKGFPESYDLRRLVQFVADIKCGRAKRRRRSTPTRATTSSPGEYQVSTQPDILIVEGLNVLQTGNAAAARPHAAVRVGLLRLLDLRGRRRGRHRELVRRAVHDACAKPSSATRRRTSAATPR